MKTCTFPGCDKPLLAKGWCQGHYSQVRFGREMAPLRPKKSRVPVKDGKKMCQMCGDWLPVSEYYEQTLSTGATTLLSYCRPCYAERTRMDSSKRKARKAKVATNDGN